MEPIILRKNDRNISKKVEREGKIIFLKRSLTGKTFPADEYYAWKYFREVNPEMIPNCLFADVITGEIAYEWLEGYESIDKKYSDKYIVKLVEYLDRNAEVNTFERLKRDEKMVCVSRRICNSQIPYFKTDAIQIADFCSKNYGIDKSLFFVSLQKTIASIANEAVLSHCDFGKSNIMVKDSEIKVVDYEYSMFSSKEIDFCRLLASVILSFFNNEIDLLSFSKICGLILDGKNLDYQVLANLTGLQLTTRVFHTCLYKSRINDSLMNLSLDLFCVREDVLLSKDDFMKIVLSHTNNDRKN